MSEEQIEIRSVISFLFKQNKDNKEIYTEIQNTYGPESIAFRTVEERTKELREGTFSILDKNRSGRPEITELDEPISLYMQENPYAQTRELAEHFHVNKATIKKMLIEHLHMTKINCRWIPHQLTDELRQLRVEKAQEMLSFFENASERDLNNVYTEDETWICFDNPHKSMWVSDAEPPMTFARPNIASKKVMIAVFWSRNGILSVTARHRGQAFDRNFFLNNVIGDLQQSRSLRRKIVHFDNARPHLINDKLNELGVKRLEHPPYSPDLAPSDFFLFGYLKRQLEGILFQTEEEVLDKVKSVLHSIDKSVFRSVYDEWIQRLKICIESKGEYIR